MPQPLRPRPAMPTRRGVLMAFFVFAYRFGKSRPGTGACQATAPSEVRSVLEACALDFAKYAGNGVLPDALRTVYASVPLQAGRKFPE